MGTQDRIYGSIFCRCPSAKHPERLPQISALLLALERLPSADDYPALTRNMFSLTSARYGVPGFHKECAIHFGLTIKSVAESWDEWLDKFESFLEILDWVEARVHLELELAPSGFQDRTFHYSYRRGEGQRREDWLVSAGPREFGEGLPRLRKYVEDMRPKLEDDPKDVETLVSMIQALARLRSFDQVNHYWAMLDAVDEKLAANIESRATDSWKERCLSGG